MAKQKRGRSIVDDIAEQIGQVLNELEHLFNPQRKKPVRVLIPIPVEDEPRRQYPPR